MSETALKAAVVVAAAAIFILFQSFLADYLVDDAYIHLTFARNLADGKGFSFNPNTPVYGVTAPLWTLILAALSLLVEPGPMLAKFLSIITGIVCLPAGYFLGRSIGLTKVFASIASALVTLNGWHIRWSASGMETPLVVLLGMIAAYYLIHRRAVNGLFFGLLILLRPEAAVVWGAIIVLTIWFYGLKPAVKEVTLGAAAALPWQFYAWFNFGGLTPLPARIKTDPMPPDWDILLFNLWRSVKIVAAGDGISVIIVIAGVSYLISRRFRLSRKSRFTALLAVLWMVIPVGLYLMRGVFVQSRYLYVWLLPLTFGSVGMLQIACFYWGSRLKPFVIGGAGMITAQQIALTLAVTLPHAAVFADTTTALKRMAERVRSDTPPESVVAVGDVGIVGFYSGRRVVDIEGLVSPEVHNLRIGRSLDDFILSEDYLRSAPITHIIDKARRPRRLSERFGERYTPLATEPVRGGMVDSAGEQWYYTLYEIRKGVE